LGTSKGREARKREKRGGGVNRGEKEGKGRLRDKEGKE